MTDNGIRRTLDTDEVLFSEGERGDQAYLVESGLIEIFVVRPDGTRVLARLGPDEMFGEMALIGDSLRSAGARAVVPTTLAIVTRETLSDQLSRTSPLIRHLLGVAVARWRDTLRHVGEADGQVWAGDPDGDAGAASPSMDSVADRDVAVRRLRLEHTLAEAMERDELELFYQPIVAMETTQVAGFEALVRWRRDGQWISPGQFMWVIEDSNLILEFGRWTVRRAAAQLRELEAVRMAAGRTAAAPMFCTVNLSVRQFDDAELFPTIERALADTGLRPDQLRLEITESAVLNNFESALDLLTRCRGLGCKLIVDDFGTGQSSLAYLHRLPVDALKIDRSFIQDTSTSERGARILSAIGRLASDLGMYAVAEGIETPEHEALCRRLSLAYGQGYHFGRPAGLADAKLRAATG